MKLLIFIIFNKETTELYTPKIYKINKRKNNYTYLKNEKIKEIKEELNQIYNNQVDDIEEYFIIKDYLLDIN